MYLKITYTNSVLAIEESYVIPLPHNSKTWNFYKLVEKELQFNKIVISHFWGIRNPTCPLGIFIPWKEKSYKDEIIHF